MKAYLTSLVLFINTISIAILFVPVIPAQAKAAGIIVLALTIFLAYLDLLIKEDKDVHLWKKTLLGAGPFGPVLYVSHKINAENLMKNPWFSMLIKYHKILIPVSLVSMFFVQIFQIWSVPFSARIAGFFVLQGFFSWLAVVYEHRICSENKAGIKTKNESFPTGGYFPFSTVGAFKYYKNNVIPNEKNFRFSAKKHTTPKKNKSLIHVLFRTDFLFMLGLLVPCLVFLDYLEVFRNIRQPAFLLWMVPVMVKLLWFENVNPRKWVLLIILNAIWAFMVDLNVKAL